jgi:hypothetical protein
MPSSLPPVLQFMTYGLSPSILHYFPFPIDPHYQELPVALQDYFVGVRQYSAAHGFWPVEFSSGRQGASH